MKSENKNLLKSLIKIKKLVVSNIEDSIKTLEYDDVKEKANGIIATQTIEIKILEYVIKNEKTQT